MSWHIAQNHGLLPLVETLQLRHESFGVLAVDLDSTGNEEVLLLARPGLPVVRLRDCHHKSDAARPQSMLGLLFRLGRSRRMREGLDRGQLLHIPRLANAKAPVVVLACLVHPDSPGIPDRNDDKARLLAGVGTVWRRRRRGMCGILHNADMGDVALGQLAALVELGEAGLDDAALLIFEALCARHGGGRAG